MALRSWVALNLGATPVSIASELIGLDGDIVLSTHMDRHGEPIHGTLDLRDNEGRDHRQGCLVITAVVPALSRDP